MLWLWLWVRWLFTSQTVGSGPVDWPESALVKPQRQLIENYRGRDHSQANFIVMASFDTTCCATISLPLPKVVW